MQQEKKLIEYVCGFYFDHKFKQVVLIWKNKPDWQKGKLNGIGGKIEKGELPITSMRREFYEETGILHNEWIDLITLTGEDWRVYFFCSIGKINEFEYVETKEEEEVAKIEIERLLAWDFDHIPNLDWLIPMAMNRLQFPEEKMSFTAAQHPAGSEWVKASERLPQAHESLYIKINKGKSIGSWHPHHEMFVDDAGDFHPADQVEWLFEFPSKEGNKEREGDQDEIINFSEWASTIAFFDDGTRLWELYGEGEAINGQFRFTTKEFIEVYRQQKG
jgi:8-oxo-dGTP diphosphatase